MDSLQTSLYTFYAVAIALCIFSTAILMGLKSRSRLSFSYFALYLGIESL